MYVDRDTFLVAVYTVLDDLYQAEFAPHKPLRRGRRPVLSDSEVLTLSVCAQWLDISERQFVSYALRHWRSYFPALLSQSAFNRRARDLAGVLVQVVARLAQQLGAGTTPYQIFDGVPVPLARLCRGRRHRLFGAEAGIGRGGADRHWYYGCQLLVVTSAEGVITGFVLAPASTAGQWLGETLLCWRQERTARPWTVADLPPSHRRGGGYRGPTGPIWPPDAVGAPSAVPYIVDDGFRGAVWTAHWQREYGAVVFTPQGYGAPRASPVQRAHSGWRQIIETINDVLQHALHLPFPRARTCWGLLTRVAAKLVAVNLGIGLNRQLGRPDLAIATLFPG